MKEKYLLSIIIPFYNVEKYIECLFLSLTDQLTDEIEVICVEDCSTDNTKSLLQKYEQLFSGKYNFKFIYREKNGGLSEARNSAFSMVRGDYIWFLDSDDVIVENGIFSIIQSINANKSDMVFFSFLNLLHENKCPYNRVEKMIIKEPKQKLTQGNFLDKELFLEEFIKKSNFYAWMFVAKADLYKKTKFQFPSGKYFEDISSIPKLIWEAQNFLVTNIPIIYYRQRESSIIGNISKENRLDLANAFEPILTFFSNKNINNSLKKTIWLYHLQLKKVAFWDLFIDNHYDDKIHRELSKQLIKYKEKLPFYLTTIFKHKFKMYTYRQALMSILFFYCPKCYFYIHLLKVKIVLVACRFIRWEKCGYYTKKFDPNE